MEEKKMQKTKLGVSIGLVGAATYFFGMFSGYLALILLAGYILIAEENEWLRRNAVKAVVLSVSFSLLSLFIGFLPDAFSLIDDACEIFHGSFRAYYVISSIAVFLQHILSLAKDILFLILGIKALKLGSIKIPFIDNVIQKYM